MKRQWLLFTAFCEIIERFLSFARYLGAIGWMRMIDFSLLRKTSRNSCHDTIVSAIKFCISELGGGLWSTRVKPGIPEHSRRYYAVTRLRGYCIK